MQKHWIGNFGTPGDPINDQGGEFSGRLILMLEKWSVRTRVTGTKVGWQVADGERHGGMLAAIHRAVVYEHNVEGYYAWSFAWQYVAHPSAPPSRGVVFAETWLCAR